MRVGVGAGGGMLQKCYGNIYGLQLCIFSYSLIVMISQKNLLSVIPAKAGIHNVFHHRIPDQFRNDKNDGVVKSPIYCVMGNFCSFGPAMAGYGLTRKNTPLLVYRIFYLCHPIIFYDAINNVGAQQITLLTSGYLEKWFPPDPAS